MLSKSNQLLTKKVCVPDGGVIDDPVTKQRGRNPFSGPKMVLTSLFACPEMSVQWLANEQLERSGYANQHPFPAANSTSGVHD